MSLLSSVSTEITCDAVNYVFFIPCSPAICGFVIISKSFFRDLIMLTQTKLIKPAPVPRERKRYEFNLTLAKQAIQSTVASV